MAMSAPPHAVPSGWEDAQRTDSLRGGTTTGLDEAVAGMSLVSLSTGPPPGLSATSLSADDVNHFDSVIGNVLAETGDGSPPSPPPIARPVPQVLSRPPGFSGPSGSGGTMMKTKTSAAATSPLLTLTPSSSVDGNSDLYSFGRQESPFDGPTTPSLPNDPNRGQGDELGALGTYGSFDLADNDGLLGLDALPRDRAQSSPGPHMRSFSMSPLSRGEIHGHRLSPVHNSDDDQGGRSLMTDSRRPRTISRDSSARSHSSTRPPLSGTSSVHSPTTECTSILLESRVIGGSYIPMTSGREGNSTGEVGDARGFGAISRPDFRTVQSDGTIPRRRSISTESGRELLQSGYFYQEPTPRSSFIDQSFTNKSGSLPSFGSLVQQPQQPHRNSVHAMQSHQPPQQQPPQIQHPRHFRSFSQPGPMKYPGDTYQAQGDSYRGTHVIPDNNSNLTERFTHGAGEDMYSMGGHAQNGGSFIPNPRAVQPSGSFGGEYMRTGHAQRSMSMSHPVPTHSFEGNHHLRRSSLTNLSGGSSFFGGHHNAHHPALQRRESLDFVPGHHRLFDSGTPVIASTEELRMFGIGGHDGDRYAAPTSTFLRQERHVSPSRSPLHVTYSGGHSRNTSDGGTTMSASPGSMSSAGLRPCNSNDFSSIGSHGHHRGGSMDDDLTHPLVGENIEVPGDDPAVGDIHTKRLNGVSHLEANPYSVYDSGLRGSMGHGGMMDSLPTHYGHETSHHLPTAGASLPLPKVIYNVKFKRTQRSFLLGPRINRDLKIGTYVKVEADRGEDLGIVVAKIPSEKFNLAGRSGFRPNPGEMSIIPPPNGMSGAGTADLKRIIRLATHDEVSLLAMKKEEEEELLKVCRGKVRQRGLPMHVVDAEYQFDRHKLTFFFEAEGRIDFRELVRDLFSMYKTRIWMQQLDKNTTGIAAGIVSPPSTMMDYGTPIIAPEYRDYPPEGVDSSTN